MQRDNNLKNITRTILFLNSQTTKSLDRNDRRREAGSGGRRLTIRAATKQRDNHEALCKELGWNWCGSMWSNHILPEILVVAFVYVIEKHIASLLAVSAHAQSWSIHRIHIPPCIKRRRSDELTGTCPEPSAWCRRACPVWYRVPSTRTTVQSLAPSRAGCPRNNTYITHCVTQPWCLCCATRGCTRDSPRRWSTGCSSWDNRRTRTCTWASGDTCRARRRLSSGTALRSTTYCAAASPPCAVGSPRTATRHEDVTRQAHRVEQTLACQQDSPCSRTWDSACDSCSGCSRTSSVAAALVRSETRRD